MKRGIALILVIILCCGLCACGSNSEPEKTTEEEVMLAVTSYAKAKVIFDYEIVGEPVITAYVSRVGVTTYEVTGKVTVQDKYGDSYTGKYEAKVNTEDWEVDLDLDELYKD